MIVLAGLHHDRDLHVFQVHRFAQHIEAARRQAVLVITVFQVALVHLARNVGLVGIPIEQVERAGRLAQHVFVDDVAPDEIDRA